MTNDHFLHSSIRDAEGLRADVDAGGYDVVMEAGGVLHHIRLKASYNGSTVRRQLVKARAEAQAGAKSRSRRFRVSMKRSKK